MRWSFDRRFFFLQALSDSLNKSTIYNLKLYLTCGYILCIFVLTKGLSLIGPRPERKIFYDEFEKYIHGFNQRLLVKPGVSGLAQVFGGYDLKPDIKIIYDI